jgi:hypothetical protein
MAGQVLVHHVVLALSLGEVHVGHVVRADVAVDVVDECLGHLGHQRRRGVGEPAVAGEELDRPARVLQARLIHVEVHPVDRLDLERDVAGQDVGDTAR